MYSTSGTLLKEQGSYNLVQYWGHRGPVLRPRCIRPRGSCTPFIILFYSVYSRLNQHLHTVPRINARHFLACIFATLIFTCTVAPPSPLLPSLTPFNLPAYHLCLSLHLLELLSCLHHLNLVLDYASKFDLVVTGRQAWVPALASWVYITCF